MQPHVMVCHSQKIYFSSPLFTLAYCLKIMNGPFNVGCEPAVLSILRYTQYYKTVIEAYRLKLSAFFSKIFTVFKHS